MWTWTETRCAYTASELREHYPDAFDRSRESYAQDGEVLWWRVGEACDDFLDNVLPAYGLTANTDKSRELLFYSIGGYNGGDFASLASGRYLTVDDWPTFLHALKTGVSDARDYDKVLPRVKIDRRTSIIRTLLEGYAWLHFEGEEQRRWGRSLAVIEGVEDAYTDERDATFRTDRLQRQADELTEALSDWIEALAQHVAARAMADYEYDVSPDGFVEACEANDWTYDATGKRLDVPDDATEGEVAL